MFALFVYKFYVRPNSQIYQASRLMSRLFWIAVLLYIDTTFSELSDASVARMSGRGSRHRKCSAIQVKITLISDHNRSTMDIGDDDYPGFSGHSKKLAGGFLTPDGRTLTDSWKLREQVALVSCPRSKPNRFESPRPAPAFPLTSQPTGRLRRGLGEESALSPPRSGHSFRIATDKGVTGCREFF